MITDDDMRKALDNIARTPDGELLYRYLQKTLCAVTSATGPECALPRNEGRRSFAAELMGHMAKGIEHSAHGRSNATVSFALAGPRAISKPGGAGRRVTADTFVAGYDAPDAGSNPGSGS